MTAADLAPRQSVELTIWLMPARRESADARAAYKVGATPIRERTYLSRSELRRDHDADPNLRSAVADHFRAADIMSVEHDWRRIRVRGTHSACAKAVCGLRASPASAAVVAIADPLLTIPMHANVHVAPAEVGPGRPIADVAQAYRFPIGRNGQGQTIAVIHVTGAFHPCDFQSAMTAAKLSVPCVRGSSAAARSDDDLELALDTQMLGTVANGAQLVLYAGENNACGYAEAFARALTDRENTAQVISVSYGVPEVGWPADAVRCIEQLFAAAALCGITVVAASGDAGAPLVDGRPQVDYPASSPLVLACGGTDLKLAQGRRASEEVWNEGRRSSGGGYSRMFDRTPWATQRGVDGRGVPDVAAHAATAHGYRVHLGGRILSVGGTSASAPLWAAFISLLNEGAAIPCGLITPLFYEHRSSELFYDVTIGGNGRYDARPGWDPCTGLGAPHGTELSRFFGTEPE